jgi:hypothetical protein
MKRFYVYLASNFIISLLANSRLLKKSGFHRPTIRSIAR